MSLAVIGSGFGRTGTKSLKQAIEMLGFGPCHHMQEVFDHPEQVAHWRDIAAGRSVPMETLFAGYRSQVDWPGAHVWRELALAYPDAKVIHSVRPPEAWWESFSGTIGPMMGAHLPAGLPPHVRAMMEAMREIVAAQTFGGRPDDKETAIAAFARRTEDVRATIPPARLLVFDTTEGWAPLCAFLGVAVPAEPFPHMNSGEEFRAKRRQMH